MGFHWNNPEPPPKPPAAAPASRQGSEQSSSVPSSVHHHNAAANSIAAAHRRLFQGLSFETESGLIPPPPPPPPVISLVIPSVHRGRSSNRAEGPPAVLHHRFIPPNTPFARAVVMGNAAFSTDNASHAESNLTVQMSQGETQLRPRPAHDVNVESDGSNDSSNIIDEADSASGPSPSQLAQSLPPTSAIGRSPHGKPPPPPPPHLSYRRGAPSTEPPSVDVSPITIDAQPFRKNRR
jgi:hypothetical protein